MDKRNKVRAVFGALVVVAVGAAVLAYGGAAHGGAPISTAGSAPPAVEIEAAQVVADTIVDTQRYSGRLEAVERVEIRPLVGGTIMAVHFRDGALVKKGDALFDIDARPYQADVDRALAQLAVAEAAERYAGIDAGRAGRLMEEQAIARRDYDQTQSSAQSTAAGVKAARAALQTARLNLAYAHIAAPVAGRMSRAELTVGNVVAAGAGAPLLATVVSISPMYAAFEVDEQSYLRYLKGAGQAARGDSVKVRLGLADESGYSRSGSIDSIDNRLDRQSGTIRVRARFDNADGALVPGLYARVQVGGGAARRALLVDDAAIGTDQEKKFVMVIDSASRAQYRQIEPGQMHDGRRIVERGLNPGDRIVVNGTQRVRPNDLVKVKAVPMPGGVPAKTAAVPAPAPAAGA